MADSSPARRTNRVTLLALLLVVLVTASAAVFGDRNPTGSPDTPATTTTSVPTPSTGRLTRPAETAYSPFDHGFGIEQYDYEMDDLSCESLADIITPDLCGVARSPRGDFMLVGNESFWDPADEDSDGFAYVPFDLQAFALRDDARGTRASSVLDGTIEKAYTSNRARLDLLRARIGNDDVLILHKRLVDDDVDAYSFWESIVVLAVSPTGAPTVVATYDGARLRVSADESGLMLSSLRYKASATGESGKWFTRLHLAPAGDDAGSWTETPDSGPSAVDDGAGLELVDSYVFPSTNRVGGTEPGDA